MFQQTPYSLLSILLLSLSLSITSYATDQALLIGVSQYADSKIRPLSGVKQDLTKMRQFAYGLGINKITTLSDQQATVNGLTQALAQLITTTNPGDSILLYFSGHGTQIQDDNGDEADGLDEVWLLYDTRLGQDQKLHNSWRDDALDHALSVLPGRKIMVIVDSCSSGDSSKGINSAAESRLFPMPIVSAPTSEIQGKGIGGIAVDPSLNHILLTASLPYQTAYSHHINGGYFTTSLYSIWQEAERPMDWHSLHQAIVLRMRNTMPPSHLHIPQLQGPDYLLHNLILPTPVKQLHHWVAKTDWRHLEINTSQQKYRFGEWLHWSVFLPYPGYVLILAVGPEQRLDQLYPPNWDNNSIVQPAGTWLFPAQDNPMQLPAGPPAGTNHLAIFVHSQQPLTLDYLQHHGIPQNTWSGITQVEVYE